MIRTKADTPSSAQQNGIGTDSTNPGDSGFATDAGGMIGISAGAD
jgi:hypothetical protein